MPNSPIYLDNNATTAINKRLLPHVTRCISVIYGNASSTEYEFGNYSASIVKQSAEQVAILVQANPKEIVFTSGATESVNLAIQGTVKYFENLPSEFGNSHYGNYSGSSRNLIS